ncbi:hypothetical protein Ga0100231_007255 [Opitutaceae bacterium TAV4]|uniref:hypothetical protein n=1 Tax=Geminisphaera colitermitum TaxID=1148786 RepID=UPI0001964FC0|nr:hypothetical protein [Geminisphaera colitermitum]RRJ98173.1 hypothetical protein Ga0100231_007255 [Opitutaceae bacterium TAV4]RRK02733.1 hypothetical protein Ga0100230_006470 [Opitutaceae bacterium TAV3]
MSTFPSKKLSSALLLTILSWTLFGCATTPPAGRTVEAPNSCVINSICYRDALSARSGLAGQRWAQVVGVYWKTNPTKEVIGHAVCVFEYKGSTLVYDPNVGTRMLIRGRVEKDPNEIARQWMASERLAGRIPWADQMVSVSIFDSAHSIGHGDMARR